MEPYSVVMVVGLYKHGPEGKPTSEIAVGCN